MSFEQLQLELEPWPLSQLGKFRAAHHHLDGIAAWLARFDLSDDTTRHILRRQRVAPAHLRTLEAELHGLTDLRDRLRSISGVADGRRPRRTYLLITASVRFCDRSTRAALAEFDGGIAEISNRSGDVTLHLLETKSNASSTHAANVLAEKLQVLGVSSVPSKLASRSAFASVGI